MTIENHSELEGKAAKEFAEKYLKEVQVNPKNWTIEYVNNETGDRWIMDYIHGEAQGGGIPRLKKM